MKRQHLMTLVGLTALASAGVAGTVGPTAAWARAICQPDINNTTVNDTVWVPPGGRCVIFNSTVTGNVVVEEGASITLVGATVNGNFTSNGAYDIRMGNCREFLCSVSRPTVIQGNVLIQGTKGVPIFPTRNVICDTTFAGGNVVLQDNTAPFAIGSNSQCSYGGGDRISGSLMLVNNTAPITLTGNQIGGYLQCSGNIAPPVNGGGNAAGVGKFGQCAGF